jgi:hypothetical protein
METACGSERFRPRSSARGAGWQLSARGDGRMVGGLLWCTTAVQLATGWQWALRDRQAQ